jgi:hypothetical protein
MYKVASILCAAGTALMLSGCASVDDVKRAQSTADQALSTAQSAQSAAQAAQQSADKAQSDVNALTPRVQELESKAARGQRG